MGLKRNVGWKLWLQGMPGNRAVGENGSMETRAIKPFRLFVPGRLPKKIADTFKLHWRPLFAMMEEGLEDIPESPTAEEIDELFDQATEYLKTRVGFIWENTRLHPTNWTISTWAKNVKRSVIIAKGTAQDKANLPDENRFNRGHTGRKRRVNLQQQTRVARRRNQVDPATAVPPVPPTVPPTICPPRARAGATREPRRAARPQAAAARRPSDSNDTSSDEDVPLPAMIRARGRGEHQHDNGEAFAAAFGHTELSATAQARAAQIERDIGLEMEEEERKETPAEARRRVANANNGLVVQNKVGRNKGVSDKGYQNWLQRTLFGRGGKEHGEGDSD